MAETAARVTDLFIVGMGDSFASGEGNPDVPVRFSPERTTDYGIGPTMRRSPAIRPASATGRRSATRSSSRRTRAGRTRPAIARSTRTSCGPRCSSPSRTRIAPSRSSASPARARRRRSASSSIQGQRVGAQSAGPVADLRRRRGAVRRQRCARLRPAGGLSHQRQDPRAEGRPGAARSATPSRARKIDLLFLSVGGNDVGFARLVANAVLADTVDPAPVSAAGSARCTALPRRAASSTRWTTA